MEDCSKPTLGESFKVNPCSECRSLETLPKHPHKSSKKQTSATSSQKQNNFNIKADQNTLFMLKGEGSVLFKEKELWMPRNAVFQQRNSSASMHHSVGYFNKFNRPSLSQQSNRDPSTLSRRPTTRTRASSHVPVSGSRKPVGTLRSSQTLSKEEPKEQQQTGLNHHDHCLLWPGRNRLYLGNVMLGYYQPTEPRILKNMSKSSPFLTKSLICSSGNYNSANEKSVPGAVNSYHGRLPKLLVTNSLQSSCKQMHSTGIVSKRAQKKSCFSNFPMTVGPLEVKQENNRTTTTTTTTITGISKVNSVEDACKVNDKVECTSELSLKIPRRWEDEYLHETSKTFSGIFPNPKRLFSLKSVNEKLHEHGIIVKVMDSENSYHSTYYKHEKLLKGCPHKVAVDDGQVEGVFGKLQVGKLEAPNCFIKLKERHKHKGENRREILTGRSGHSKNTRSGWERMQAL